MSSPNTVLTESTSTTMSNSHPFTPSLSTASTQVCREDEQLPCQNPDLSVKYDAVQSQHSNEGNTPTQSPHLSPATSATAPATMAIYSKPIPGSKKQNQIFYTLPFEWGEWTRNQWEDRFRFVQEKLECLVQNYLPNIDYTNRPSFHALMVGTSPSQARPSVVVMCHYDDFKAIRALFRAKAREPLLLDEEQVLPIKRIRSDRTTEKTAFPLPRLKLVYYLTRKPPIGRPSLSDPLTALLGPGDTACGGTICYSERSATLGIALDVWGIPVILTVDHLFSSEDHQQALASGSTHNPIGPESFSNSEDLDEDESNSLWEDDDEYDEPPLSDDEHSVPHQHDSEMMDANEVLVSEDPNGKSEQWTWELLCRSHDLEFSANNMAYLDWALTYPVATTPEASDIRLNTIFPPGKENEGIVLDEIHKGPPEHVTSVYLVTGRRGFLSGRILQTPSFLPPHTAGKASCEVWTVIFDNPDDHVQHGESGSVVIDKETYKIYGHVVGCNALGHAYIAPLEHLVYQLRDHLDLTAGLTTTPSIRTSSENLYALRSPVIFQGFQQYPLLRFSLAYNSWKEFEERLRSGSTEDFQQDPRFWLMRSVIPWTAIEDSLNDASSNGHKEIAHILLRLGASLGINVPESSYGKALQTASTKGHQEIVQLLLDWGVDIDAFGGAYGSALQAAAAGGHQEIVQILLDRGAYTNAWDDTSNSALQAAAAGGHRKIVEILLDQGADINAQGGTYGSALQAAAARGHREIVEILLGQGADINAALHAAAAGGHQEVVEMLLEKGADDRRGDALFVASLEGYKEIVERLLQEEVDHHILQNAAHIALRKNHVDIYQMIRHKSPSKSWKQDYVVYDS